MHDNHALFSVNPTDGTLLWQRLTSGELEQPMIQPHVVDDGKILVSSDPGIALIEVNNDNNKWTVSDVWTSTQLKPGFNDFVVHQGHIYGLDDGILCCLDVKTGERLWKKGRYKHGQVLLLADQSVLLVSGEQGEVLLVAASPDRHEELTRFQAIEGKTWNHPVLANGRLFIRNGEEMACYEMQPGATVAMECREIPESAKR
jgi:outer membrane protein assembly factor BamB